MAKLHLPILGLVESGGLGSIGHIFQPCPFYNLAASFCLLASTKRLALTALSEVVDLCWPGLMIQMRFQAITAIPAFLGMKICLFGSLVPPSLL